MEALTLETITVPVPMTAAQIAADLEQRIRAGEYDNETHPLPTYDQLADLYSTSRRTAARAYAMLRDRDVVVGVMGLGVFVADDGPA